jgi:hypothetical protein
MLSGFQEGFSGFPGSSRFVRSKYLISKGKDFKNREVSRFLRKCYGKERGIEHRELCRWQRFLRTVARPAL